MAGKKKRVAKVNPVITTKGALKIKKKKVVELEPLSSSEEEILKNIPPAEMQKVDDEDDPKDADDDVEYAFAQKSFKSIFSDVRSTLRGRKELSEEELNRRYKDDPILRGLSADVDLTPPRESRGNSGATTKKSNKILVSKPSKNGQSSCSSVGNIYTGPIKSRTGSSSVLDRPVTESQLAVADLDTDTELDADDMEPVASSSSSRFAPNHRINNGNVKREASRGTASSSDDDDELERQFKKFLEETDRCPVASPAKSSDSGDCILELSTSSARPSASLVELDCPVFDGKMVIRVHFRGQLYKIEGNRGWDVERVRVKLSELVDVPETDLLLYTEENGIKMVDGKTLSDYDVDEGDFLEAVRRGNDVGQSSSKKLQPLEGIRLKFQKAGVRKPVLLTVSKYKTLKEIRHVVAAEFKADAARLSFKFDGDPLDLKETPEDLDLEDDFCIDVYEK